MFVLTGPYLKKKPKSDSTRITSHGRRRYTKINTKTRHGGRENFCSVEYYYGVPVSQEIRRISTKYRRWSIPFIMHGVSRSVRSARKVLLRGWGIFPLTSLMRDRFYYDKVVVMLHTIAMGKNGGNHWTMPCSSRRPISLKKNTYVSILLSSQTLPSLRGFVRVNHWNKSLLGADMDFSVPAMSVNCFKCYFLLFDIFIIVK